MVKINSDIDFGFRFEGVGKFEDINNEVIRLNSILENTNKIPYIAIKRVYSIAVELLYNVVYHGIKLDSETPELNFEIKSDAKSIYISSSNYIKHSEITSLRKAVAELNVTNAVDLRKMKAHQIKNGGITEKGGAGLGLIDIRMKSENPIQLSFKLENNDLDWVTFEVKINLS